MGALSAAILLPALPLRMFGLVNFSFFGLTDIEREPIFFLQTRPRTGLIPGMPQEKISEKTVLIIG